MPPSICPTCGAVVPPESRACPQCGSDDETGWSEQAYAPNPDLPDEDFDYEEFSRREFEGKEPTGNRLHPAWWIVALALILALLFFFVF